MTELLALRRALLDVRRRLRAFFAALAGQIVAPAPPDPRPNPAIHGGRDSAAAPRSARRAAAASRRVPPPPLQPSNPSTLQPADTANPFKAPWVPSVDWRIVPGPGGREVFQLRPGASLTAEQYDFYRVQECLRGTWNSRNPCPN